MNELASQNTSFRDDQYEAPAIVYETIISTRAGSPIIEGDAPQPPSQEESIDLFPSD